MTLLSISDIRHISDNLFVSSATMLIYVQTTTGKSICLTVQPDTTIESIKMLIEIQTLIPPEYQRILFVGKEIFGTLDSNYIANESTITVKVGRSMNDLSIGPIPHEIGTLANIGETDRAENKAKEHLPENCTTEELIQFVEDCGEEVIAFDKAIGQAIGEIVNDGLPDSLKRAITLTKYNPFLSTFIDMSDRELQLYISECGKDTAIAAFTKKIVQILNDGKPDPMERAVLYAKENPLNSEIEAMSDEDLKLYCEECAASEE